MGIKYDDIDKAVAKLDLMAKYFLQDAAHQLNAAGHSGQRC